MTATVINADCLTALRDMPSASVSAVITDPPYGLSNTDPAHVVETLTRWATGEREYVPTGKGFMGKSWDAFVPPPAVWDECFRVLKPGGHLLCFAGTRTMGLMETSIRFAGFDIRPSIAWLYGSGFPKAKGQLKPAFEPIIVARRPFKGSTARNVAEHGTGVLNTDATRVPGLADAPGTTPPSVGERGSMGGGSLPRQGYTPSAQGRWPANVALDGDAADALDEQSGERPGFRSQTDRAASAKFTGVYGEGLELDAGEREGYNDSGGASRFFPTFRYQAKAPSSERPSYVKADGTRVAHPTVKPLGLMRWLVRLVTPPGGLVLDPFAGSGATVEAAMLEGFDVTAIEREADYLPLIQQRVDRMEK